MQRSCRHSNLFLSLCVMLSALHHDRHFVSWWSNFNKFNIKKTQSETEHFCCHHGESNQYGFRLSNEPPAKEPHFNLSFWFKVSNKNLDVTPDTIKNLVLTFNLKNSNQIAIIFVTIVELKKITNQPVCASWLEFSMVKKSTQIMGASFGTTTENRTPVPSVRGWCPNR